MPRSNIDLFNKDVITDYNFIYFLGYFWADGHVAKKDNSSNLTIQEEDGKIIRQICENIGFNVYFYDKSHKNRKNVFHFKSSCRYLHKFLADNDFLIKSQVSADKILSKIPENLHYLFFRGFLDGDGCIFVSKNNKVNVTFCGPYQVDWSFVENFLKTININYNIVRRQGKTGNNSSVRIRGLLNILPLLNTIYQNDTNKLGLPRKHNKFLKIKEICKNFINNKLGISHNKAYMKSDKKYVISIKNDKKVLPAKRFETIEEAIKEKMKLIEQYNTLEYKLRKLIDYWDVVV